MRAIATLLILLALLGACVAGDNTLALDAAAEPTTCAEFELLTVDAPDVGEVLLDAYVRTPGISYHCDDGSTWSYHARRRDGRLGSYGRFVPGSDRCAWFDAIDSRTPALGTCNEEGSF